MSNIVEMRQVEPCLRSGFCDALHILIVHNESAVFHGLGGAAVERNDFRPVGFDGLCHFGIPDGVTREVECLFPDGFKNHADGVSAGDDRPMTGRNADEFCLAKIHAFRRKNRHIAKAGFAENGSIILVLANDRDILMERCTYRPIGLHIDVVGMDMRHQITVNALQRFLDGHW